MGCLLSFNKALIVFRCIDGIIRDCPRILVTRQLQYLRNATEILYLEQVRCANVHSKGKSLRDTSHSIIQLEARTQG